MHSVFGTVMMLYTQHFLAILVFFVVLAANVLIVARGQRGLAVVAAVVVLLAINNATWTYRTLVMADQIVADFKSKRG
jgi:hypothetical protein